MVIGVLSLQGDFAEHLSAISACSVRSVADLEKCQGLIIPGGESTTIGKLLLITGLDVEIKRRFEAGDLKIWGTCAGAILCANEVVSNNTVLNLGIGAYKIARNAYGNQLDSFETVIDFNGEFDVECAFIRAPKIEKLEGEGWEILASYRGEPVIASCGNLLISTCHPELYENTKFYEWIGEWFRR